MSESRLQLQTNLSELLLLSLQQPLEKAIKEIKKIERKNQEPLSIKDFEIISTLEYEDYLDTDKDFEYQQFTCAVDFESKKISFNFANKGYMAAADIIMRIGYKTKDPGQLRALRKLSGCPMDDENKGKSYEMDSAGYLNEFEYEKEIRATVDQFLNNPTLEVDRLTLYSLYYFNGNVGLSESTPKINGKDSQVIKMVEEYLQSIEIKDFYAQPQ